MWLSFFFISFQSGFFFFCVCDDVAVHPWRLLFPKHGERERERKRRHCVLHVVLLDWYVVNEYLVFLTVLWTRHARLFC